MCIRSDNQPQAQITFMWATQASRDQLVRVIGHAKAEVQQNKPRYDREEKIYSSQLRRKKTIVAPRLKVY